jgi:hypothetical protein
LGLIDYGLIVKMRIVYLEEEKKLFISNIENRRQMSIYRYISFNQWSDHEKIYW